MRFDERVLTDIMCMDGKPVIQIVDEVTRFIAALFLDNVSTASLWSAFLKCWATIYTGLPRKTLVDHGSQFGGFLISLGAISIVDVQRTGIESHSSYGLIKYYHQPLRNTVGRLKMAYPNRERQLFLGFAVKAVNETLRLDGLVLSELFFGEFPSPVSTSESRHPCAILESRVEISNKVRREIEGEMASVTVRRALRHATKPAEGATLRAVKISWYGESGESKVE